MNLEMRLIELDPMQGIFNTVIDRAIMESVSQRKSPATLMFTEWKPTVSLGISQNFSEANEEECMERGVDIVRRNSGGQAVYLDGGYIVFNFVAPPEMLPKNRDAYRRMPVELVGNVLNSIGVPVEFHDPDNLVIREGERLMTIGNSGQIISKDAIALHGSVRYSPVDIDTLTSVINVYGNSLKPYQSEILEVLSDIKRYSLASKSEIKNKIAEEFQKYYDANLVKSSLTDYEMDLINKKVREQSNPSFLIGSPSYLSKGVCYFFVNGKNLIPSLSKIIPYNKPSSYQDSTIQKAEEVPQNA